VWHIDAVLAAPAPDILESNQESQHDNAVVIGTNYEAEKQQIIHDGKTEEPQAETNSVTESARDKEGNKQISTTQTPNSKDTQVRILQHI